MIPSIRQCTVSRLRVRVGPINPTDLNCFRIFFSSSLRVRCLWTLVTLSCCSVWFRRHVMSESPVKRSGSSGKPVVTITASAAASVTAAAKAAMNKALKDNAQINDAVSKVLDGYDWTLVPVAAKYVSCSVFLIFYIFAFFFLSFLYDVRVIPTCKKRGSIAKTAINRDVIVD